MNDLRVGFFVTQFLGHIAHGLRLQAKLAERVDIRPTWIPVYPMLDDRWSRIPVVKNNLTLLYGLRVRDELKRHPGPFDAFFCHTQEAAILLGDYMKRVPTVLSLDATPISIDSLGEAYGHKTGSRLTERLKYQLVRKSFRNAAHLVTWSGWAKTSLVDDYGIAEERVAVIPPGIDAARWRIGDAERAERQRSGAPRVLFVGGDFERKGGADLLQCARLLKDATFDIVTRDKPDTAGLANVRIHNNVAADTGELLNFYRDASIFVLPTLGDVFSLSVLEAMAMRLPVVTTDVGAIRDLVVDGETAIVIPPKSPQALHAAIAQLLNDPERRLRMGNAARQRVEQLFDAEKTYGKLLELIATIARNGRLRGDNQSGG